MMLFAPVNVNFESTTPIHTPDFTIDPSPHISKLWPDPTGVCHPSLSFLSSFTYQLLLLPTVPAIVAPQVIPSQRLCGHQAPTSSQTICYAKVMNAPSNTSPSLRDSPSTLSPDIVPSSITNQRIKAHSSTTSTMLWL